MNLMLLVIFASIAIGLCSRRFGAREQLMIAGIATIMVGLYYFVGRRFM